MKLQQPKAPDKYLMLMIGFAIGTMPVVLMLLLWN